MIELLIQQYGLLAIFFLMLLESALIPIPSEIVVPFGGFLVSLGYFSLLELVFAASLANTLGSILAYFFGYKIRPILELKWIEEHLRMAEQFFADHGKKAVFFGRILPAVRTFISLPAGLSRKVPFFEFALLTFLGSIPWNFALGYLGYVLGKNWEMVHKYGVYFTLAILPLLAILAFKIFKEYKMKML